MSSYKGVVYSTDAEAQLEALIDSDIRYQSEPAAYEFILERDPETLASPAVIGKSLVYIFITAKKRNSPSCLAITYMLLREQGLVKIIDIRPAP
jgi:hypothetical protein